MAVGTPLTQSHRKAQLAVRARVLQDLTRLWPAMDWTDLDRTFPAWSDAAGDIITRHRATSTALAAAYLRAFRQSQGIAGPGRVVLAGPVPAAQLAVSLRVTALAGVKAAAARGITADTAMANAFVRSSGAATRLVLAGGRDTITETVKADPRAQGFERVTSGNACEFCQRQAERTDYPADFATHDHCGCSAQPAYR